MAARRELFKGPIRPLKPQPTKLSYTQAPASKGEIWVKRGKLKEVPGKIISLDQFTRLITILVTEFSSQAFRAPFLDPSVVQKRLQAEKQPKI